MHDHHRGRMRASSRTVLIWVAPLPSQSAAGGGMPRKTRGGGGRRAASRACDDAEEMELARMKLPRGKSQRSRLMDSADESTIELREVDGEEEPAASPMDEGGREHRKEPKPRGPIDADANLSGKGNLADGGLVCC